ncbi:MAG: beta strand repeat-containing protein, partial [Phycisphaerales bacterium JB059]
EVDLTGDVAGTGDLTLEPFSLTRAMELGGALDAGAGFFDLTVAELNRLQDGFNSITIGRTGATGALGFHGFTFLDDVSLVTSGVILIDGLLANTGGSVTLGDATDPTATITLDVGGNTITTTGGAITLHGDAVLAQDTTLDTGAGGGDVTITGVTDASVSGGSALTVTSGTGAIELGKIGSGAALSALSLAGGDITLDGIGTFGSLGVTGMTDVVSTGTLTLGGQFYHGASQSYDATGGFVATSDLVFDADGVASAITFAGGDFALSGFGFGAVTDGGDFTSTARFLGSGMTGETLSIDAGSGAVALADVGTAGARLASVSVSGATVSLNDVYTLAQVGASGDQTFVGALTLNSTYDSMGGDITFDGNVTGLGTVIADAAGGTITFTRETITAPEFDLTAAFYDFTGMTPTMTATTGDIDFNGGSIRLLGPTEITFVAVGGASTNITLATIVGSGSERVVGTASGFIQLNGVGSSAGTGLDDLLLTASDVFFSGAVWTDRVEFRPFAADGDILLGAGSSGSTLDITDAMLAALRGNSQVVVGRLDGFGSILVGGFSLSADLQIRTPLAGGVITVTGPVNITGGSDIWFRGDALVLDGNVSTQGGDITSDSGASVSGPVLLSTQGGDLNFAGSFEGLVDGDGDLEIDYGSGEINFTGGSAGYGLVNRLASLSLTGDQINLNTVRTTGDQTFTGSTLIDNLPVAGVLDSVSGDITFDGMVTIEGDSLITTGGGRIAFLDLVEGAGTGMEILRLNAGAGGTVVLTGVSGAGKDIESLIINAMSTTFHDDVYVADQLTINSDSVLNASGQADGVLTFCAADALFNGAITSSVSGASGLEALVSGTTTFAGPIGQGSGRLRSISTDAPGTTVLADDISTQLGMTFGDDVLIAGDVTLRSYDPTAAGSIRFMQTVNADGTPGRKLTVLTDLTGGELDGGSLDPDVAVIQFVGDIGTAVGGELAELNLNYSASLGIDGHLVVPVNATIIFGDSAAFLASGATRDFTVNVGQFNMGFNEKVGVPGALHLNASDSARLGDITSAGDMFVTTPSVTFLLREFGSVYDPMSGSTAFDEGLDFVSGGTQIVFTTGSISYLGSGANPIFAVAGGNVTIGDPLEIRSFDSTVQGLMSGIILLDVRSLGPTNTNVAEAIAGAVPRESQSGVVQEDTTVGLAAQEALRELGIYPRATLLDPRLTEEQRTALFESVLESLLGLAIYNDMPGESEPEYTEVTVDRLELELVDEILADYRGLFRREVRDPETGEMKIEDRRTLIRDVLGEAVDGYFEALDPEDFDTDQFIEFLRDGGEQTSEALGYIVELQSLFQRIQLLGLSAFEVAGVKNALFGAVRPADLTATELESLLDRAPIVDPASPPAP